MKKIFSLLMVALFATSMAFADGEFPAGRMWSDPVIYSYDQQVTWYYDMSDSGIPEGATLALWNWQPKDMSGLLAPYGNGDGETVADVPAVAYMKNEGNGVYSYTLTPTEFYEMTEAEIVANTEGGFWQQARVFGSDGIYLGNTGSIFHLFPHQILLGLKGLANDAIATDKGAVNDMAEHAVYPTTINATTPIAFILNNDELGASWDASLHFVSGVNGWNNKVDYNWDNKDASKCSTYFGYDDIFVFNVTNPAKYYSLAWDAVIDDIQFLFTPYDWASPVILETEQEFEQATPWETTAIKNITPSAEAVVAKVVGGVLTVNAASFDLYSITGNCIAKSINSEINVSNLPAGVYIVKTAQGAVKIIK